MKFPTAKELVQKQEEAQRKFAREQAKKMIPEIIELILRQPKSLPSLRYYIDNTAYLPEELIKLIPEDYIVTVGYNHHLTTTSSFKRKYISIDWSHIKP